MEVVAKINKLKTPMELVAKINNLITPMGLVAKINELKTPMGLAVKFNKLKTLMDALVDLWISVLKPALPFLPEFSVLVLKDVQIDALEIYI